MLLRIIGGFCVATVLTQMIIAGVYVARGTLNMNSITHIVALLNGIDITGQRLRMVMEKASGSELPSYDEVLAARVLKGLDIDVRLQAQERFARELQDRQESLKEAQTRFDRRREEFFVKLDELRQNTREDGMQELTRTLQALDPEQVKNQLLKMIADDRIEDVVNIIQATPLDKRTDILSEFVSPDEEEKLADILRRIGEGEPAKSLIDRAGNNR